MKFFQNILLIGFCFVIVFIFSNTADGCESIVTTQLGYDWTDWYDPCGTRLNYKFSFVITNDGSPQVIIWIDGAGITDEYDSYYYDDGPGKVSAQHDFEDGYDHRALIDYQPAMYKRGFCTGTLTINYLLDTPD